MKKIVSYFIMILILFNIFGCDETNSVVQTILEKEKIYLFQSPKENGDLIILSDFYDLEKNVEYSIDYGENWSNDFSIDYDYISQFETMEIWMRKKEVITPYKTFLKSPNIVFNYVVKDINTNIPDDFHEIIIADPLDRLSEISNHILNTQTFLVAREYECGFSLSAHIKESGMNRILTNNMEFVLIEEEEKESSFYQNKFNWVNIPEFSELQYDLDKTYFLIWRYKENDTFIPSLSNEIEINPQILFE